MTDGEFELIARFVERLPQPKPGVLVGSGDDAAVVEHRGPVVISVDAMVEGVHFTLPEFSHLAVGRKALAAALSDLAAMGADADEAYIVLGIPPSPAESDLLELADGIAEVAASEGVSVIGGDVTRAPALLLSVTAVGSEPAGSALVTRSGARPGDRVVVTGELGGAAAALRLLEQPPDRRERRPADEKLLERQLHPRPRLAAGRALAAAGASAMIDVSDGLAADAGHLARSGGVAIEIQLEKLPLAPGLAAVAGGEAEATEMAASGGEDLELLACLAPDRLAAASEAVEAGGCALTEIGLVAEGEGAVVRDGAGRKLELAGYDHLRGMRLG